MNAQYKAWLKTAGTAFLGAAAGVIAHSGVPTTLAGWLPVLTTAGAAVAALWVHSPITALRVEAATKDAPHA